MSDLSRSQHFCVQLSVLHWHLPTHAAAATTALNCTLCLTTNRSWTQASRRWPPRSWSACCNVCVPTSFEVIARPLCGVSCTVIGPASLPLVCQLHLGIQLGSLSPWMIKWLTHSTLTPSSHQRTRGRANIHKHALTHTRTHRYNLKQSQCDFWLKWPMLDVDKEIMMW